MATAQNKKLATAVAATITGPILSLVFSNGKTLNVDSNALSDDIRSAAIMHGLKQKLIDAAAIARDPDTGRTATIDDKYSAVLDVYTRITAAEGATWNKARIGGGEGGGSAKGGLLVRAMMRLTSKSRDAIVAFLDEKSKDELAALRKNPRIAEIIAQLQVETANTSDVDSDALLDSLMSGGGNDIVAEEADTETDTDADDNVAVAPPTFPAPTGKAKGKAATPKS